MSAPAAERGIQLPQTLRSVRESVTGANDVQQVFDTVFDNSLLAQDSPTHVTNEHHGRFALAGGGSVTLDTRAGARIVLPDTINGDLPSSLQDRALLLQGDQIPGSRLRSRAHVLPLEDAVPIKRETAGGTEVTVVYPPKILGIDELAVPVVKVTPQATTAAEHTLSIHDTYRLDSKTGDPVARAGIGPLADAAIKSITKPEARKSISTKLMTPVLR